MNIEDLLDKRDRDHALRESRRHSVQTYKRGWYRNYWYPRQHETSEEYEERIELEFQMGAAFVDTRDAEKLTRRKVNRKFRSAR